MKYKVRDVLVSGCVERKVLFIKGNKLVLSQTDDFEKIGIIRTETEIDTFYTLKPKEEPLVVRYANVYKDDIISWFNLKKDAIEWRGENCLRTIKLVEERKPNA